MENPIKRRESNLEKSIGKWVAINVTGNGSIYGKIKNVEGRDVTINPSRAFRYNSKEKCNLWKFVDEDAYLEVSPNGYYLEPMTKESLDYINDQHNKNILKEKNQSLEENKNN